MKSTIFSVVLAGGLIFGAFFFTGRTGDLPTTSVDPVRIVDGIQIVSLSAKGGYYPKTSVVSAGVPTVLRVNTSGTFDCSSSIRIPDMNISTQLPSSGLTDINLGTLSKGTIVGSCGMGMYFFEFQAKYMIGRSGPLSRTGSKTAIFEDRVVKDSGCELVVSS